MKSEKISNPPDRISTKIRSSIVWKLNIKLFLRNLLIFLVLDILLLTLSAAGLLVNAEQKAAMAAAKLNQTGQLTSDAEDWLQLNGYNISKQTEEPEGFRIPKSLQPHLPQRTASGVRSIDLPDGGSIYSWQQLQAIAYNITIEAGHESYRFSYHPQNALLIFSGMFAILLIIELLLLLKGMFSGARMIRQTLQPIKELAQTAQDLSIEGSFSPEQLKAIAGKLDDINAARLDTRISVDATQNELKSLATAINGLLDRINESYRSQVRFVSDASHELRTPIAVIQGYANLLDRWGKNDEKTLQESIEAIKEETANMKELVEKLLFLARGDNNTMTLQIERFELSSLAEEVLRETQMIDSGHLYDSSFLPVFINADKSLIKQALRVLIDNAMKYSPQDKRISIKVAPVEGNAVLTVQDEGIGITPEAVPKIFDRFFRADESRSRATGGTGLGLSIAKWIIERHGGHMEVLSRLNAGTRISIVLPATA